MADSGGSNLSFNQKTNGGVNGRLSTSEFETQRFFSTTSVSARSSDYCPYSLRESQLSTEYKYDILLVYDPEENTYFVDKLMEYLTPQNLDIFDLSRDAPPGLPQRKVLQSALQLCRYTCIVITRKFITNFWLQLRTDMSIQDMLDNEEKLYSVIVVVMDASVKKADLPLDLATLSPLFFSEKFFENRIKLAFSKTTPFPSLHSSIDAKESPTRSSQPKIKYEDAPTSLFDTRSISYSSSPALSFKDTSMESKAHSRLPCEHGDGTFVMPPSIIPSTLGSFGESSVIDGYMHRTISVTVNSTGSRQPQETCDAGDLDSVHDQQIYLDTEKNSINYEDLSSCNIPPTFSIGTSVLSNSEENETISNSYSIQSVEENNNFSFNSQKEGQTSSSKESTLEPEIEKPEFFSLAEPNLFDTAFSSLSELEISETTLSDYKTQEPCPPIPEAVQSFTPDRHESECLASEDDGSCTSLPAQLNSSDETPDRRSIKKYWSMRSIVGSKLVKMSKRFKKDKK